MRLRRAGRTLRGPLNADVSWHLVMQSLPIGTLSVYLLTTLVISPDAICQENRTSRLRLRILCPHFSIADLHVLFGAENVLADDIPVGEGAVELGTVIFPEFPRERVEILWKDAELRRSPRTVGIVGDESDWVTNHGVTLGVDLKTLEYINGAPFMLAGFGVGLRWHRHRLVQGSLKKTLPTIAK